MLPISSLKAPFSAESVNPYKHLIYAGKQAWTYLCSGTLGPRTRTFNSPSYLSFELQYATLPSQVRSVMSYFDTIF